MVKVIRALVSRKGGVGKSTSAFALAEKYKEAIVLDIDDANSTSMRQLAYRNPHKVSLRDSNSQRLDRSAFNTLFESVANAKNKLFIADFGGGISQELIEYFRDYGVTNIREILDRYKIDLQLICVVGGANEFKDTMAYLKDLLDVTEGKINVTALLNEYFPMSPEQTDQFQTFAMNYKIPHVPFQFGKHQLESASRVIRNVMQAGKGIDGISPFDALYFKGIKDLQL